MVRWETREPGSIGAFQSTVFHVTATSHAEAIALAEPLFAGLERRLGGDAMAADDLEWRTAAGTVMPIALPCQYELLENIRGTRREV